MATIANPPSGFDFPLYADFSASSYPSDPLNSFVEDADANSAHTSNAMAFNNPDAFHLFTSDAQQQQYQQPVPGARPIGISGATSQQPNLHPSVPNPFGQLVSSSSETVNSIQSATSSHADSPHRQGFDQQGQFSGFVPGTSAVDMSSGNTANLEPDSFGTTLNDYQNLMAADRNFGFVDPSLLQPTSVVPTPPSIPAQTFHRQQPGSPALSHTSSIGPTRARDSRHSSPYVQSQNAGWAPYSMTSPRRSDSLQQPHGSSRTSSVEGDADRAERTRCPECGKPFRDMKAHMLTHQNERPEKCPIPSCEYHKKGFSRKYDKNRHTLTHYKGTMVCGFCPHSGSAAEKSFNRADVFKRHLMTVHGVEQNPPNSRKKAPNPRQGYGSDTTGKCSICQGVFSSAQDFYEHLEDCVLNVVQQVDPGEAINEQILTSMADDEDVKKTLEAANLPTTLDASDMQSFGEGDDDDDDEEDDEDDDDQATTANPRSGRGNIKSKKDDPTRNLTHSRGLGSQAGSGVQKPAAGGAGGRSGRGAGVTYSKGGVSLLKQGRKRRKNYPVSWGCNPEKMKMKKRVLTCWDGQRRLVKDDMMLSNEFEVRKALPAVGENAYVTDLDVQTLRRADAFYSATEEERGPWEHYLTNVPMPVLNN